MSLSKTVRKAQPSGIALSHSRASEEEGKPTANRTARRSLRRAQEKYSFDVEVHTELPRKSKSRERLQSRKVAIDFRITVSEGADSAALLAQPAVEAWAKMLPLFVERMAEGRNDVLERAAQAYLPQAEFEVTDLEQLEMQKRAAESIIKGTTWLSAADVGNFANRSQSNPGALANRWKKERKIFALKYDGTDKYPRYEFDDRLQPLPVIAEIISLFGEDADPWQIAAWFESSNAWLGSKRPREMLGEPGRVLEAARNKSGWMHG